jgi:hypothetical protein
MLLRWLPGALVILIELTITIVTIIAVLLVSRPQILQLFQEARPKVQTFGDIYVNMPEVYARERLVNDRFRQQAWLDSQLLRTDDLLKRGAFAGIEGRVTRREMQRVRLTASVGTRAEDGDGKGAEDSREAEK